VAKKNREKTIFQKKTIVVTIRFTTVRKPTNKKIPTIKKCEPTIEKKIINQEQIKIVNFKKSSTKKLLLARGFEIKLQKQSVWICVCGLSKN